MTIRQYLNAQGSVTFTVRSGEDHHQFGRPGYGFIDVTGQQFGKLTVVEHKPGTGFLCKCECGGKYTARYSSELRLGRRTSCGKCTRGRGRWQAWEDELLRKFAGKISGREIAEKIGRKPQNIRQRAVRLNISLLCTGEHNHKAKHTNHDVELCRQLKDAGLSLKEIAEKMEISEATVSGFIWYRRRLNEVTF